MPHLFANLSVFMCIVVRLQFHSELTKSSVVFVIKNRYHLHVFCFFCLLSYYLLVNEVSQSFLTYCDN